MKKVLSIAGSDCSGGAGIQADLKTFAAHGVYGMSVITSVVAENTARVISYQDIAPTIINEQMTAVFEDIYPDAVKIGMLSCADTMLAVASSLQEWQPKNIVLDPVMYAKNGDALMEPEAEKIADRSITSLEEMERAAKAIYETCHAAVLIKGGHRTGEATDILYDGKNIYSYTSGRIVTKNTHGTGCTFSSAIASQLALGVPLDQAISKAKKYITTAIAHSLELGEGHGPTNHFYSLYRNGLKEEQSQ